MASDDHLATAIRRACLHNIEVHFETYHSDGIKVTAVWRTKDFDETGVVRSASSVVGRVEMDHAYCCVLAATVEDLLTRMIK